MTETAPVIPFERQSKFSIRKILAVAACAVAGASVGGSAVFACENYEKANIANGNSLLRQSEYDPSTFTSTNFFIEIISLVGLRAFFAGVISLSLGAGLICTRRR